MRIAFLSHKPHLNGLYKYISLSKSIERIVLYTRFSRTSSELATETLELHPIRTHTFGVRFLINKLFQKDFYSPNYISGLERDLVEDQITHLVLFDFFHWYTLQALRYKRKNPEVSLFIWSETKGWPKRFYSRMVMYLFMRQLQRNAILVNKIFVYTHEGMSFMKALFPKTEIKVIPAPVDTMLFKNVTQERSSITEKKLRILCNARFSLYKNHHDLLMAIRRLLDAGYDCRLTLIGRAESGKEYVQNIVRDMSLENHVTWLDPLPRESMPDLYRAHDVLVLPSYNEAIGMVVPEAMACGIPTITSDTVGANIYVIPDQTGLIFETGNIEALAASLKYYIDEPEVRVQHGKAAATHINEHYSVQKITDRFLHSLEHSSEQS